MYNREFKQIDSEEKAYLLGQAFGDGCNHYSKNYYFKLTSTIDDLELYKKIQLLFPFFKLHIKEKIVVLICSAKLCVFDLKDLGLHQNKCKQDKLNNFNLPKLDNYMNHFIRGFFDADGSVYYPTRYRSRNNTRVEIGLGSENFCIQLYNYILSLGIKCTYISRDKIVNNKKYKTYSIIITSRLESQKFYNYIYENATIYLNRKKKLFEKYEKSELQLRRELLPVCPNCNVKFRSGGFRNGNLRIKCPKCHKNRTVHLPLTNVN